MRVSTVLFVIVVMPISGTAFGEGVVRQLPAVAHPGVPFSVVFTIDPPAGIVAVGLEDKPPAGWTAIANITNGGTYDAANHKLKWGPFFAPSIPLQVSYDITPPGGFLGQACFTGTASFDGFNEPVAANACVEVVLLPGDFDADGDVDLTDFEEFAQCFNGPGYPPATNCPVDADLDDDGDVDLVDVATFTRNFTGDL